jgi:hypothetical protein
VFAVGGHHELAFGLGLDAVLLHQATHPFFAHPNTPGQQFLVHAWPAVFLFDFGMDGTHVGQQGLVAVTPGGVVRLALCCRAQVKYPLALTSSTSQAMLTGYCFLIW